MSKYMTSYVKAMIADARCDADYDDYANKIIAQGLLDNPTLFQAQLCRHGACFEGLIGVGKQTAKQFYNSTDRADWIHWLIEMFAGVYVQCYTHDSYGPGRLRTVDEIRAEWPWERFRDAVAARNKEAA